MNIQDFINNHKQCARLLDKITQIQNQKNLSTTPSIQLERQIQQQYDTYKQIFNQLMDSIHQWSNNRSKYNINPKEIERRTNQINDLKNRENTIFRNKNSYSNIQNDDSNLYNNRKYIKGNQQETDKTQLMNNRQLLDDQQRRVKQQDDQIDQLIGTVGNIKIIGENINQELDQQNELLDDLDKNVDKNIKQIKKTSEKLNNLLANSSNCCLMSVIFLELAILVVIIMVL